jgi:hypothetical protein
MLGGAHGLTGSTTAGDLSPPEEWGRDRRIHAAVTREDRMGGVTSVVVFAVIFFVLVIGLFIFVSRR